MLAFRIALRYIFSKKSTQAINIVSWVSMVGMGMGALALIVVLSVFNGFEGLVLSLYNSFYPELEVRAAIGKTFEDTPELKNKILHLKGVSVVSSTVEETAYFEYSDEALIGTVKGVDDNYNNVTRVKDYVRDGGFILADSTRSYAVVGANISYPMNIDVARGMDYLRITVPRKGIKNVLIPDEAFTTLSVVPSGIFSIQQEFDSKYVFVSLTAAQELLGEPNQISAYEIKLLPEKNAALAKTEISQLLGNDFTVRSRYEQKAETYRMMLIERWVTTAILGFIIAIISFNIIGSLSMLVIEKSKDISILKAMGASNTSIRKIYLLNGLLSSLFGALIGLCLGYIILLLQMKFHFLKFGGEESSFVINYYPVALKWSDPFIALVIIVSVSIAASYFPAKRAGENALALR